MQVRGENYRLNWCLPLKLFILNAEEVRGIPSVAVKCVDIGKNTGGEDAALV